jgi:hypothetical protein
VRPGEGSAQLATGSCKRDTWLASKSLSVGGDLQRASVEECTRLGLVVNLKAARALGVPRAVLSRADQIID